MPLARLDKKFFPFFDSVKTPVSESGTSPSFRNNGYTSMTIEVSNATTIAAHVEGCVNIENANGETLEDNDCHWTPLKLINLTTLEQVDGMNANGIYLLTLCGCQRIRVVVESVTGTATILSVSEG